MFFTCVSNDYMEYLMINLEKIYYPFKNPGFNLSMVRIDDEYELYVFRNIIPFKILFENNKRLIPGIPEEALNKNIHDNDNISNKFIWHAPNYYETYIFFVASLQKNGHLKINTKIKPKALLEPYYIYNIEGYSAIPKSFRKIKREDLRLFKIKNKIFYMDSVVNIINEVIVENNEIILHGKKLIRYIDVCNIPNKGYRKIFEKNWSYYKHSYTNSNINLFFFNDFIDDGIYSIKYTPKTKYCINDIIIKYNNDAIPHDNEYIRFSFGSSIYSNNNIHYGVGHIKSDLKNNKNSTTIILYDRFLYIHRQFKKVFKEKYKTHPKKIYCYFFFKYNENDNTFFISNGFCPIIVCNNYIFSLTFPVSIIKKYNDFYVSMGYGDYTNIIAQYTQNEIDRLLIHDAKYFNLKDYKIDIVHNKI